MSEILEGIASLATAMGIAFVVYQLHRDARWRVSERDREAQLELSARYGDFLKLGIERPELQLFDTLKPEHANPVEDARLHSQQLAGFQLLLSIFEDAHFLFGSEDGPLRADAWRGWVKYVDYWASRPDFSLAWQNHLCSDFNQSFLAFMNRRSFSAPRPGENG